jgi:hypothetical protein
MQPSAPVKPAPMPISLRELKAAHPHAILLKRGAARDSLAIMADCLANGEGPGRRFIDQWNYNFLATFDDIKNDPPVFLAYFKELHDRIDGKAAQFVTIDNKRDIDEISDAQLNAAIIAIRAILGAQGSGTGISAPSEPEPTGEL